MEGKIAKTAGQSAAVDREIADRAGRPLHRCPEGEQLTGHEQRPANFAVFVKNRLMRPTPLLKADSVTLILEAEADGKFITKTKSWDEKCTFCRGRP